MDLFQTYKYTCSEYISSKPTKNRKAELKLLITAVDIYRIKKNIITFHTEDDTWLTWTSMGWSQRVTPHIIHNNMIHC